MRILVSLPSLLTGVSSSSWIFLKFINKKLSFTLICISLTLSVIEHLYLFIGLRVIFISFSLTVRAFGNVSIELLLFSYWFAGGFF